MVFFALFKYVVSFVCCLCVLCGFNWLCALRCLVVSFVNLMRLLCVCLFVCFCLKMCVHLCVLLAGFG